MGDPESVRRKKLLFRALNRGTREEGLLLGAFAARHLAGFDAARLDRFEALLDLEDGLLYDWVAGRAAPNAEQHDDVTRLLLDFQYVAP